MLAISSNARIFFFQNPIDMRKGIEALSCLIENCFTGELFSGAYFVFVNGAKDNLL
jgi:hypothetical protein